MPVKEYHTVPVMAIIHQFDLFRGTQAAVVKGSE